MMKKEMIVTIALSVFFSIPIQAMKKKEETRKVAAIEQARRDFLYASTAITRPKHSLSTDEMAHKFVIALEKYSKYAEDYSEESRPLSHHFPLINVVTKDQNEQFAFHLHMVEKAKVDLKAFKETVESDSSITSKEAKSMLVKSDFGVLVLSLGQIFMKPESTYSKTSAYYLQKSYKAFCGAKKIA